MAITITVIIMAITTTMGTIITMAAIGAITTTAAIGITTAGPAWSATASGIGDTIIAIATSGDRPHVPAPSGPGHAPPERRDDIATQHRWAMVEDRGRFIRHAPT